MTTGPLMVDLEGLTLTAEEAALLEHDEVGGLILFARNYTDPAQLSTLVGQVRAVRPDILIAVDQEGGRVQRFREGFTRLPPMGVLGERFVIDPEQALGDARELGWLMASELRAYDIDFSFAPVLDVDWKRSGVIGDRAFSGSPDAISLLASAFVDGMHQAGMAATGKHFPGHGWAEADSHKELPEDERTLDALMADDIQPFTKLIESGLDAVMPAHVVYSAVKPEPAGFSPYWLREVLRKQLGFDGVIFSDDLNMKGAGFAGDYPQCCDRALEAGCDMVLICNNRPATLQILEHLKTHPTLPSERLERMRGKPYVDDAARLDDAQDLAHACRPLEA